MELRVTIEPSQDTSGMYGLARVYDDDNERQWSTSVPGMTIPFILSVSTDVVEEAGYTVDGTFRYVQDVFVVPVTAPLPKEIDACDVRMFLDYVGIHLRPREGSVSFNFSDGRATVVRKRGNAPYRMNIKE